MAKQEATEQAALPLSERCASNWDRLHRTALELADADSDDDDTYKRIEDRLRKTGIESGELALRRAALDRTRPLAERRLCARAAEVLRCIRRGSAT